MKKRELFLSAFYFASIPLWAAADQVINAIGQADQDVMKELDALPDDNADELQVFQDNEMLAPAKKAPKTKAKKKNKFLHFCEREEFLNPYLSDAKKKLIRICLPRHDEACFCKKD